MTDQYRVYTKVLQTLKGKLKMHRQGHVVTLAMMITGSVMSRKAQLAGMSGKVPVAAKEKSVEMRMRRWVKHEKIDVEVTYMPFARQILAALATAPLVLAMDGSTMGRSCMVLMVRVIYRKRALRIASGLGGLQREKRACSSNCACQLPPPLVVAWNDAPGRCALDCLTD